MNDKLLPCPFCGGEARLLSYDAECGFQDNYYIDCPGCTYSADYGTADNAIAAWNRRAQPLGV